MDDALPSSPPTTAQRRRRALIADVLLRGEVVVDDGSAASRLRARMVAEVPFFADILTIVAEGKTAIAMEELLATTNNPIPATVLVIDNDRESQAPPRESAAADAPSRAGGGAGRG